MTLILAVLAVTFLVGVLIGGSLTERVLEARTRRQAVVQRAINSQWLKLKAAQRALFRTYPIDPVELKCGDYGQAEGKLCSGRRYLVARIFQFLRWAMQRSTAARIPERCLLAFFWAGESSPPGGVLAGVTTGSPR
jgi:hypothetical protein